MSDIEKREAQRLVGTGYVFKVEYDTTRRTIFGRKKEHHVEEYRIEEPTLGTLDRMSQEWVDIKIGGGGGVMDEAKLAVADNAMRMCRVIAIAVMGSEHPGMVQGKGAAERKAVEREIERMAGIFAACVKPSQLKDIAYFILAASNLADFMTATTLMRAGRTTRPSGVAE